MAERISNGGISRPGQLPGGERTRNGLRNVQGTDVSFGVVLEEVKRSQAVSFSKHAEQRLSSRQISLSTGELESLNKAVEKAAIKGARESLILLNDMAFVVNVVRKVVVTAISGAQIQEDVFTNIDSAVIVRTPDL